MRGERSSARAPGVRANGQCGTMIDMIGDQVKEILDRVLTWPRDDQEKVVRFVSELEEWRAGDNDITDEEWKIIEQRAARRELATDEEVEGVSLRPRDRRYGRKRSSTRGQMQKSSASKFLLHHDVPQRSRRDTRIDDAF